MTQVENTYIMKGFRSPKMFENQFLFSFLFQEKPHYGPPYSALVGFRVIYFASFPSLNRAPQIRELILGRP